MEQLGAPRGLAEYVNQNIVNTIVIAVNMCFTGGYDHMINHPSKPAAIPGGHAIMRVMWPPRDEVNQYYK